MKTGNLVDNLLFATGEQGPAALAGPYETEAMVYVGDVYSLVASGAPGANPKVAAASLTGGSDKAETDSIWPLIR
jgi:hypothetical protein